MAESKRIILGIDPGTIVLGYGIIEIGGTAKASTKISLVSMGVVQLAK